MAYQLNINWPEFLEKYWQKQPVVLKNAIPDFVDPITPDELAGLAMEPEVDSRLVSLKNGKWQASSDQVNAQTLPTVRAVRITTSATGALAQAGVRPIISQIASSEEVSGASMTTSSCMCITIRYPASSSRSMASARMSLAVACTMFSTNFGP